VNRIISVKQSEFYSVRNLSRLLLLVLLFQLFYISAAGALSLQTPTIYTACNHLERPHSGHSDVQCLQHCASATDNYTQNVLADLFPYSNTDMAPHVVAYINPSLETFVIPDVSIKITFSSYQNLSKKSPVYLNTARLRI